MIIIILKLISLLPFITLVKLIRRRRETSPTREELQIEVLRRMDY